MFFTTAPIRPTQEPDKKPIFYSVVIFPGLGQFHQRRFGAGLLYTSAGVLTSVIFILLLARHGLEAMRIIVDAWSSGIDPDLTRVTFAPVFKSGAVLIGVYLANIYDVWYAWYRSHRAWRADPNGPMPSPPA